MVIHLWGKFWMAAWRGERALTWVTGVVAFVASVVECFTGYLSQQNFDSQWISTSGKDAFNAVGVGAFFNVMNFGQMLMWHIVLIPLVLVALVGAHVLAVRVRGVVHPLPVAPRPGPGRAPGGRRRRPGRLAGPDAALRHPQGSHGGHRRRPRPGRGPGRPAVLARRSRLSPSPPGPRSPPPTSWPPPPASSPARARPPPTGRPTTTPPAARRASCSPRRPSSGSASPSTRPRPSSCPPLEKVAPTDPALAAALDRYNARLGRHPELLEHRLRQGRHQGHASRRHRRSCPPPPTGRYRPASPPS